MRADEPDFASLAVANRQRTPTSSWGPLHRGGSPSSAGDRGGHLFSCQS